MNPRLLDEVRSVLEGEGYQTYAPEPDASFFYFEDLSVIGQVQTPDTANEIIEHWESVQDTFLRTNAPKFLRDATKAWNLYTVMLTTDPGDKTVPARLFAIEEDFRGTRKIVRAGVLSRDDILSALAPLLPLQRLLVVGRPQARQRLAERLSLVHHALTPLTSNESAESIAAALIEVQ